MTIDAHLNDYFVQHRDRILAEYFELLRFPTISSDPARLGDCARCARRWASCSRATTSFRT